ncbi:hypothetical protein BVG16_25275 [Paenibacillus selenitireducens]|uniref:Sensor histidine kinase n=1 Tax=Paenibacillus selenitireducens TaxID=1324314 RepID=A0A1T2X2X4_9BACL|nr:sensor histidine kinase [Paenibacillus selenitireducens]OPA74066.1 hypothetical protein BVG16_25275 [Paenibacillus selenitireducens]
MRNPFKTYRLGRLFFILFAGFMAALLIVLMAVSYKVASSYMSNQASKYQQEILNELSIRIDNQMSSVEQIALSITRNNDFLNYLNYEELDMDMYDRLVASQKLTSYFTNLVYSWNNTVDSIQIYMRNPLPKPNLPVSFIELEEARNEEWFSRVELSDFAWVGERKIGIGGTETVISFARKVYSNSGKYLGLLVLNMKMSAVHNTLLNRENENQGIKRVLMGNGQNLITSAGFSMEINSKLNEFITVYSKEPDRYRNQKTDLNQSYLVTESNNRTTKWSIIQFTPWKEIANDSLRIAYMLGAIGLIAVMVALFFTLLLSHRFMKPIIIMTRAMGRFSVDMQPVKMPGDYTNEFGILFSGYSNLMERVKQLYIDLEKQYIRQKELDVKALQAMINPHFLYNTLDQINWMAIEANQPQISRILELTGKMFRMGLSRGESILTVHEEMTYINYYLQIQRIRMEPHRLDVTLDLPSALENYYVPKMLLQPFVENAIMHGFHGRNGGSIVIRVEEKEAGILFSIQDDGQGFQTNRIPTYQANIGGYGIRNVRERIDALFGEPYGVSITSELNQGTTIHIYVPKRDKGDYFI